MSEKKKGILSWYSVVLILVILVFAVLLIIENTKPATGKTIDKISLTGHATESSTYSNVTIQKYLSIATCTNMSLGILFGDVSELPATNINASHNYDGASSGSSLCVNVSADSNTPVDFCIKANTDLTSIDLDVIVLANETYQNSSTTNLTLPTTSPEIPLTTGYVKSGDNIAAGSENYYRFWLDVPASQPSGDYNNTVYFKGVTTTLACGS